MPKHLIKDENFTSLSNMKGDVMFCLDTEGGSPSTPSFQFDGKGSAILSRAPGDAVRLANISPDLWQNLKKNKHVLIAEGKKGVSGKTYEAPIKIVNSLSLNSK